MQFFLYTKIYPPKNINMAIINKYVLYTDFFDYRERR